ncbi:MAG: phosphatase PAP2 family protein [Vicinamibacterales bacterium]
MRSESFSSTPAGSPASTAFRLYATRAIAALLVFAAWTLVVRVGISQGSRHTVWTTRAFGNWPTVIEALDGSNNMELSIRATFESGETLGSRTTGTQADFGDPANINGSRFVTGSDARRVQSMSAFVTHPVDQAPYNQFELAIYADDHGAPGHLIARSQAGELRGNAWNTVPIDVVLAPRTPYWFFYNSNGRSDAVNNLTFSPVVAEPLDSVIRAPRSAGISRVALVGSLLGSPVATALVAVALSFWLRTRAPHLIVWVWAGFAGGLLLEFVLKQTLFVPYSTYPSGHALRAVFLATVCMPLLEHRWLRRALIAVALFVSLSAVHPNRHYSEEVLGGALAGWSLASAALAFGSRGVPRGLTSVQDWQGRLHDATTRRTGRDRRMRERRAQPDVVRVH